MTVLCVRKHPRERGCAAGGGCLCEFGNSLPVGLCLWVESRHALAIPKTREGTRSVSASEHTCRWGRGGGRVWREMPGGQGSAEPGKSQLTILGNIDFFPLHFNYPEDGRERNNGLRRNHSALECAALRTGQPHEWSFSPILVTLGKTTNA